MDAGDLRVFAAVARFGGMNRAAAALNTVQSNVTARVRLLEAALGTPLFHRHSRGATLTSAGRRLLPYADRVAHLLAEARHAVVDDGTPRGSLTLGSLETTAGLRLPPLLASYAADYPEVDLVLKTGTTCELVDEVVARRLDGAFVCGPVDHPELAGEVVFSEELVVVTAPVVRDLDGLTERGKLKVIVFRAGCSYRDRLDAVLAPSRAFSAASRPGSASACCRGASSSLPGVRNGLSSTNCRLPKRASTPSSSAPAMPSSPAPWRLFWNAPARPWRCRGFPERTLRSRRAIQRTLVDHSDEMLNSACGMPPSLIF